jgi:phosphoglycolate phosphatase/putative hydrolase of the HAD superfamily
MKVFRLPDQCTAILFDMDCTLYSNPEYGQLQIDLLIGRLAKLRGKTFEEMNAEITLFKKNWAQEHEGQQISIGNTLVHFGISIRENVKWRKELYQPEQYLVGDRRLRSALERLESQFTLAVVTNNPVSIAERTLSVLGVEDMFHEIVGLDTCGVSKPNEEMFMRAAMHCGAVPESCVSVGDRYDIDIALPLELGMGGILVDGVEDVYQLPEMLV